jgi:hypothetical protein
MPKLPARKLSPPNTTQHNTTQHNTTQHNTTQHNTTQHGIDCRPAEDGAGKVARINRAKQGVGINHRKGNPRAEWKIEEEVGAMPLDERAWGELVRKCELVRRQTRQSMMMARYILVLMRYRDFKLPKIDLED